MGDYKVNVLDYRPYGTVTLHRVYFLHASFVR